MDRPAKSLWEHIADSLSAEIAKRRYAPGERLPTESRLAAEFGVNRHTIRQALDHLRAQGLIRTRQGSGTYVEEFAVRLALARRTRLHRNLALAGLQGRFTVLGEAKARAAASLARELEVAPRSPLLVLTLSVVAGGVPLHVSRRYFPCPRFAAMADAVRETGSITAGFERCGVDDYVRRTTRVHAGMPDAWTAAALRQRLDRPVLCVESINTDLEGRPIEYTRSWLAGDRITLTVENDDHEG